MKRLLRLYPRSWRARYGAELGDLVDEVPHGPGLAFDLIRGAGREHVRVLADRFVPSLRTAGGPLMPTHPFQRHPTAWALIGLLAMAPTTTFVVLVFIAYQLKVPGLAAAIDPILATIDGWRIKDLFLLTPFLAFALAAAPLVGVGLARAGGELRVTVALRARWLNVLVVGLALLAGSLLVGYVVN